MSLDLANRRQAEYLEAAAVGQDWRRPIDERVQSTGSSNDVHPGTDIKMIRVPKNYLGPHLVQFSRIDRFDAAL